MNLLAAILLWLLSWLFTPDTRDSSIKQHYPEIEPIADLRGLFLHGVRGVSEDAAGLVAGLTIGVRDQISEEAADQMRTLSLTHLVAVSGANLAIVLASVYFLLAATGVGRAWRFGLGFLAMAGYVLLVGPESSVIRAATMALFVMIGLWLGRGSSALNSLSLAVLLLLIVDPALSKDFGFALSAFATAGLLIFAPWLFEFLSKRMPDFLALGISASASAQLYTTPVLLILEPSLPLYSVLANLLVEPVVAPVTILGILGVLASAFYLPLTGFLTFLASLMTSWILSVAAELSEWPEARLNFVPGVPGILIVTCVVVLVSFAVQRGNRHSKTLFSVAGLMLLFGFAWSATDRIRFENFEGDWHLLMCDVGQGDAVLIRSEGVIAMVDVGPDPQKVDRCLVNAGVEHIDLLVLTHFDSDHVAGISGALRGRTLGHVLISGFEDDRPVVELVEKELQAKAIEATLGHTGLAGSIGQGAWKVLAPTADATEAEDSNDASVVFAVEFPTWSFLGLGDLGESGQERLIRNVMPDLQRLADKELVVKVAHHGSADQSEALADLLEAETALFSVGENNYGHPTSRAIELYERTGSRILRTDSLGAVAMSFEDKVQVFVGGKL